MILVGRATDRRGVLPYDATWRRKQKAVTADMASHDVINRRRDTRSEFTWRPVDVIALRRILSDADSAPSVRLSQPKSTP
ncbi:hypothetical protein D0Z08_15135 [Nocardioides immobilis]|uniref:Uncharacterized protein n=1 Tax=Nocardioides immobilis TaxID=2049295 RepID=A0A417Y0Y7_9ACTN|nr:hypothetical protein D0Z08_15135 [Nocardioides immobilis]